MSINHAILGILSAESLTGYDLKKIMQESSFMYWSGNNNQIYKALVDLHERGFVSSEVHNQESAPPKKVYTITRSGLDEIKRWALEMPEVPEIKKPFLIQLAFSAELSNQQIVAQLDAYERFIRAQIAMEGRERFSLRRTEREAAIWRAIGESVTDTYSLELTFIKKLRETLSAFDDAQYEPREPQPDEGPNEHYMVIEGRYILLDAVGAPIDSERAAVDLISLCAERGVTRILIPGERLTDEFFRLATGVAGAVLGRFSLYGIQVAAVIEPGRIRGKFEDFKIETNRGNSFRVYESLEEAAGWLLDRHTD